MICLLKLDGFESHLGSNLLFLWTGDGELKSWKFSSTVAKDRGALGSVMASAASASKSKASPPSFVTLRRFLLGRT